MVTANNNRLTHSRDGRECQGSDKPSNLRHRLQLPHRQVIHDRPLERAALVEKGLGLGAVPAIIATFIYSVPPLVRLTDLGIRLVDTEVIEAADSFGASKKQKIIILLLIDFYYKLNFYI